MKKSKGQTIDLFYTGIQDDKKKKKKESKKTKQTKKGKVNKTSKKETIDLNNEIIIGLTPKIEEKPKETKKKSKDKKKKSKVNKTNKTNSKNKARVKTVKGAKKTKKQKPKSKKSKIIKWTCLALLLIAAIIMFLLSSVFNIKEIVVINNNRVPEEEIITLSSLQTGVNMFKTSKSTISKNIKTNPYVEDVKITRGLTGTITLDITERIPTFMLKFSNAFVYINNQGYMLEITETPLELPVIVGFSTSAEEIKEGNRLCVEDLKKLDDVIKLIESAKLNKLENLITQIDISDSNNYILTLESEQKTVQFGEFSNISIKMLKIEAVLEQEKGNKGEIYFQDPDKTVFREETNY